MSRREAILGQGTPSDISTKELGVRWSQPCKEFWERVLLTQGRQGQRPQSGMRLAHRGAERKVIRLVGEQRRVLGLFKNVKAVAKSLRILKSLDFILIAGRNHWSVFEQYLIVLK